MKAILTKFLPATDTKPTRIKAQAEGCKAKVYTYDLVPAKVAQRYLDQWLNADYKAGDRIAVVSGSGQLPNGDYCHLISFTKDLEQALPFNECLTLSNFLRREFYREAMPKHWPVLPQADELIRIISGGMGLYNQVVIRRKFEMMMMTDPRNTYNDSIFERLQFQRGSWSLCAAQDYNVDMRYVRKVILEKW